MSPGSISLWRLLFGPRPKNPKCCLPTLWPHNTFTFSCSILRCLTLLFVKILKTILKHRHTDTYPCLKDQTAPISNMFWQLVENTLTFIIYLLFDRPEWSTSLSGKIKPCVSDINVKGNWNCNYMCLATSQCGKCVNNCG